jgi:hypothetical protein
VSVPVFLPFLLGLLTRGDDTDTSQNVGKQLPYDAA